jgi:hypothetical protein
MAATGCRAVGECNQLPAYPMRIDLTAFRHLTSCGQFFAGRFVSVSAFKPRQRKPPGALALTAANMLSRID